MESTTRTLSKFSNPIGILGGYNSLVGPTNRRLSCSTNRRKSNSVESSRIFSAYPMGGSFGIDDYFIESDGDEADDEYDQLANAKLANSNQYQLSVPPEVSHAVTSGISFSEHQ